MKKTRLIALAASLTLCVGMMTGCTAKEAPAAPTAAPAATPVVEAVKAPGDVLMMVNETEITRANVNKWYNVFLNYFSSYYDVEDEAFQREMYAYALDYATTYALINQYAAKNGLTLSDEEKAAVEAQAHTDWEALVDSYIQYYGGLTESSTDEDKLTARTNALAVLESMGFTETLYVADAVEEAVYAKVHDTLTAGATVTDEQITAAFEAQVAADKEAYDGNIYYYELMTQFYGGTSYYMPEGYRGVIHILLDVDPELLNTYQDLTARLEEQSEQQVETVSSTDGLAADDAEAAAAPAPETTEEPAAPVTQADVDAAKAAIFASVQDKIDDINTRLANGEDFYTLIDEYGKDPGMTAESNRSNGYSVHMDSVVWDPAFVSAAYSVSNVGDVAEPVIGMNGVHIVKYLRDVPAGPVEMTDEIKAALHDSVLTDVQNEMFDAAVNQWRSEATIRYADELLPYLNILEEPAEAAPEAAE